MRKIIIVGAIGLPLLFFLRVYAIPSASPTWTVRLHAAHGLRVGDAVEEASRRIGQVVGVTPYTGGGTDIAITLDPGSRDRLRERATFRVTTPTGAARSVLNLIVFDERSPALPPGSVVVGVESDIELELKRQLLAAEGAVRVFGQQLDALRQTLDQTARSEEKRRLEESVGGLAESLRRTRDAVERAVTEEMARWKKLYEQLFPHERDKLVRTVS